MPQLLSSLRARLRQVGPAVHLYRIVYLVLLDPLNRGQRLRRVGAYLHWFLWAKPRGRQVLVHFENQLRSRVYADSDSGVSQIFTRNVDYYDDRFIRSFLRPGDFIIDAGCNVGNRTLALADIIGSALLLDANPLCLERVQENILLNELSPARFEGIAKAVGAETGSLYFSDFGGTHCSNQALDNQAEGASQGHEVPVTTIDTEMERLGQPACRFIKFDLEGHDLQGLQGAEQTLRRGDVVLVKFERWASRPLEPFLAFFAQLNWEVFALDSQGRPSQRRSLLNRSSNLFAMPKARWQTLAVVTTPAASLAAQQP